MENLIWTVVTLNAFAIGVLIGARAGRAAVKEIDGKNLPDRGPKGRFVSRKSVTTEQLRREVAGAA